MASILEQAGYSRSTALRSTEIIRSRGFLQVMKRAGISDIKLARCLNEGLSAKKQISALVIMKPGEGAKEMGAGSKTYDFVEVPDHAVRHKFLETGLKLKGYLIQDQEKPDQPVIINIVSYSEKGAEAAVVR